MSDATANVTGEQATGPSGLRRLAAIAALVLVVAVVLDTLVQVATEPVRVLAELLLLVVFLAAGWVAATTTGANRVAAVAVAAAIVVGLIVLLAGSQRFAFISLPVGIVAILAAVALARFALGATTDALTTAATSGAPVAAAVGGVLFINLKSGGRKAERFGLVAECERRGIRPVVLEAGMDWPQIVRDVAASGVDVLGAAGGDGSQAMVGTVASELGLPMVVVPAGTRNHLALDLGLDRNDIVGALDAYGDAVERTMDLADVNGHAFVNNVSLGLYAAIVRSPDYRVAKVDTTLATLPQVLGPDTEPFDLRFAGPDGEDHRGAHVIQISNNPYGTTAGALASRPRLDTHQLGVITLVLGKPSDAPSFLAGLASGHPERFPGFNSWAAPTFEVTSDVPIDMGLDGESMTMDPPLHFSIRPSAVRVRLPKHAIGYSPAARNLGLKAVVPELGRVILGHPSRFDA
jgi:diacylglycerol kinase family enzyme